MVAAPIPKPSRTKVNEHRARLRSQGLRPIQFWLPDTAAESFRAEAQRQTLAVAASDQARDDQGFIDAIGALERDHGDDA